jgi:hypothetical protein
MNVRCSPRRRSKNMSNRNKRILTNAFMAGKDFGFGRIPHGAWIEYLLGWGTATRVPSEAAYLNLSPSSLGLLVTDGN